MCVDLRVICIKKSKINCFKYKNSLECKNIDAECYVCDGYKMSYVQIVLEKLLWNQKFELCISKFGGTREPWLEQVQDKVCQPSLLQVVNEIRGITAVMST